MPRNAKSPVAIVLAFFASASLEIAELVLDLAKQTIADRRAKGAKVRAGKAGHSGTANDAVNAATASIGQPAATAEKPKRKDTRKGRKRGKKAAEANAIGPQAVPDLPPQDAVADDALPLGEPVGEPDVELVGAQ